MLTRAMKRIFSLPLVAALLVALPGLFWVTLAERAASLSAFGRDQGIFQFFGWAVRQGDLLYRDIRDVNGPLTTFVHAVFQLLGGEDEHRFRILDLAVTGAVFALVGACLPGIFAKGVGARHGAKERVAFALSAWVVLSAQYLSHTFWHITQRETFAAWFLLASLATQLLGSSEKRHAWGLVCASGAFAAFTWFGKPTFVLFFPAQLLALFLDDEISLGRARRFVAHGVGAAFGSLLMGALLAVFGDLSAFVRIVLFEAPVLYRYIWARAVGELFEPTYVRVDVALSLVGGGGLVALVALQKASRRALVIALLPLGAIANLVVQRKGFPYHYQPLGMAAGLVWLALIAWASERAAGTDRIWARASALGLAGAVGLGAAWQASMSPHVALAPRLLSIAATSEGRASEEYFQTFRLSDYYPWDMRLAAHYVKTHTPNDARIQVYGMDPYFFFLARRLSATPYVYAYDLNVSAALAGGTGARPDEAARQRILAMQREHERDMLERLRTKPPGAFVVIDYAPMTTYWDDGLRDFEVSCPDAAAWMEEHYTEAATFGVVHVFLPNEAMTEP